MIKRRTFLNSTLAAGLVASLPQKLLANIQLDNNTLSTVSDGYLNLPGSFLFEGMPEDALKETLKTHGIDAETVTPECNLALYQSDGRNVLFDVGSGADFMPNAGTVLDSLDALGLAPEDITDVIFTHAHPDHIWGVLDDFDEPLFYEANYYMGAKEWDYWWDPETVNSIGEARAAFAVGAKRRMEAIQDQITLINSGDEPISGIQAIETYGHTPGHLAFDIEGKALVVGDAIGNHHVALEHPEWASGSDQIPEQAIGARKMLLDRLTSEKLPVVGFHLPNGGIGQIETHNGAYKYVSA